MSDSSAMTPLPNRLPLYLCSTLIGLAAAWPVNAKPDFPKTAEDVLIVDCLLPGQVRKLGRINAFLSQRRPARLSQFECALRGGEYVEYDRANLQTALSVWLAAASGGDVPAMVMVGEAFAKGSGQAPDYAQAAFWFQRASDAGNKRAQQNFGHLYELGLGVAADREKALNLYRMASAVPGERVVFTSTLATETMLQGQLDEVKLDLDAERAQRAALEGEVKTLKSQLDTTQADAAAKRAEVARLKKAVAAAPKPAEVTAMWLVLEEQIRGKEREIAAQSSELAKLERAMLRGDVSPTSTQSSAQLGQVKLTIVQPVLLAGRGAPTALAATMEPVALIGRILDQAQTDASALGLLADIGVGLSAQVRERWGAGKRAEALSLLRSGLDKLPNDLELNRARADLQLELDRRIAFGTDDLMEPMPSTTRRSKKCQNPELGLPNSDGCPSN